MTVAFATDTGCFQSIVGEGEECREMTSAMKGSHLDFTMLGLFVGCVKHPPSFKIPSLIVGVKMDQVDFIAPQLVGCRKCNIL